MKKPVPVGTVYKAFLATKIATRADIAVLGVRIGATMCPPWTPVADHVLFVSQQMVPTWTSRALA